ncbi:fructose-2,6-bisphosphatase TIGAR-like [Ornithodoros turicata]|uniref:fructose-2,6-bisphosphatase TIGAR-like n=1 Tax=Ornithodoros turicata TaxID=34597 RepID=UPI003139C040
MGVFTSLSRSTSFTSKTTAMFSLTLARHGETEHNKENIIQGQLDVPLSAMGLMQARLLGKYLEQQKYTHVFSSDLSRARETARCILAMNRETTCPVSEDKRLRERKFGSAEGKRLSSLKEAARNANQTVSNYTPPGAETLDQVHQRAVEFLQELCHKLRHSLPPTGISAKLPQEPAPRPCTEEQVSINESATSSGSSLGDDECPALVANVLIVSHGAFLREMVRHLVDNFGCHVPGNRAQTLSPNGAVSRFTIDLCVHEGSRAVCHEFHDREHLMLQGAGHLQTDALSAENTAL